MKEYDVVVVGAGPAGLAAGLACAAFGLSVAVVGPRADRDDGRSAALLAGSVNLLRRLGVWPALQSLAEPLRSIRLIDGSASLLRAPEVLFNAHDIELEEFGYSVANADLTSMLDAACADRLSRVATEVREVVLEPSQAILRSSDGNDLVAKLVIAADGRSSATRAAAGIELSRWSYDQSAIVCNFDHSRAHRATSTELHRASGPLTVVPGRGQSSSLVWVENPSEAARLIALDDAAFLTELDSHLQGMLGGLSGLSRRRSYPLSGQTAKVFGQNRVALVGEAAHVIPPIGAQGLNLGLRDAAAIADIARDVRQEGGDIGGDLALARYHAARRADVGTRTFAVDILNRSLLATFPGAHFARGLGLFALASSPALRARIMREGVMPSAAAPTLTQPVGGDEEFASPALDGTVRERA